VPAQPLDRALVVRGGALGDFLLTLPVLRALRGTAGHLELLGYPSFVEVASCRGVIDAGRSIEYGPMSGFFARGSVPDPRLRDYFGSFDLVLSYLYDPDGVFAENLRVAGVKRFLQGPHKPSGNSHAIEELLTPLQQLGLNTIDRGALLGPPRLAARRDLIALHPGSGSRAKNWPTASWHGLADKLLIAYPDARLVIIGGEADRHELEALDALRRNPRVEFWENLPLVELARRLEAGCDGYVGHDTGVSHLAAELGLPSLLLFGPTDPAVWAPPSGCVAVLRAPGNDLTRLEIPRVLTAVARHITSHWLAPN
jgi:heptosyltransferase-3